MLCAASSLLCQSLSQVKCLSAVREDMWGTRNYSCLRQHALFFFITFPSLAHTLKELCSANPSVFLLCGFMSTNLLMLKSLFMLHHTHLHRACEEITLTVSTDFSHFSNLISDLFSLTVCCRFYCLSLRFYWLGAFKLS